MTLTQDGVFNPPEGITSLVSVVKCDIVYEDEVIRSGFSVIHLQERQQPSAYLACCLNVHGIESDDVHCLGVGGRGNSHFTGLISKKRAATVQGVGEDGGAGG